MQSSSQQGAPAAPPPHSNATRKFLPFPIDTVTDFCCDCVARCCSYAFGLQLATKLVEKSVLCNQSQQAGTMGASIQCRCPLEARSPPALATRQEIHQKTCPCRYGGWMEPQLQASGSSGRHNALFVTTPTAYGGSNLDLRRTASLQRVAVVTNQAS